jgi:hypothetical protein
MAKEFIEDECTMIVREKKREVRKGLPGRAAKAKVCQRGGGSEHRQQAAHDNMISCWWWYERKRCGVVAET